jgi:eukaryotic-like serine/threonine-protein kinase
LRDELADDQAGGVEAHVGGCPGCQGVLDQLVGGLPDTLGAIAGPAAQDADEEPPAVAGYTPEGRIGVGGMGVVWRVRDDQIGRRLAVKVMRARGRGSPALVERFLAEARVCGQLTHPAIVPVHATGRLADGRPYYAMKLVEGQTLAELLDGEPAPAGRRMEFVQVFGRVCQAVAFAHGRGVIHRDLKPDNVMVGAHGEVQVMDWGLAKVLGDAPAREGADSTVIDAGRDGAALTRADAVLGTVAYMPPEQARGMVAEVDRRSDVFGLGAILCKILTGAPPYTGSNPEAVYYRAAQAIQEEALSRLRACGADPELIRLAERCLAARKEDRPADGGEVAAAVAAYLTGVEDRLQQERLERERFQVRATEERRRRKLWLGLTTAVLAAVGLAAGGGLYWQGQRGQRHREAHEALEQAEGRLWAGEFAAAKEPLTRAMDRLGDDGPAELTGRYADLRAAWQLVEDLRRIQRARITPTAEGLFDNETAQNSYLRTFADAGYDLASGDPKEVAGRIRDSAVTGPIVEAIDNWALVCEHDIRTVPARKEEHRRRRDRLLEVARAADPDPDLRDKIRSPRVWGDRRQLEDLAELAPRTDLSPRLAALLAELLRWANGEPERLLRAFQSRHPDDFWLNFDLAKTLDRTRPAEALRYYQAAVALGPHNAFVYVHMGNNLANRCYCDEAVGVFRQALGRVPPGSPEAVALRNGLAMALVKKGDLEGAFKLFQENARRWPDQVLAHLNLGISCMDQGRFSEALDSLRRGNRLAAETGSRHRGRAGQLVRQAEKLAEVARRLEAGAPEPTSAEESFEFAEVCFCMDRYADAVGFYRRAFDLMATPPDPQYAEHLYNAASAAALAAGQVDAANSNRRADLRKQALIWLRESLNTWGKLAKDTTAHPMVEATLRLWQRHPNLAGIRDPAAVAQSPEDEQRVWQQLWADVNALLGKVQVN